ncbi:hypothetical protein LRY65_00090 [Candidatus Woesebacteria bacterium]|nr:hypothetical protein [Candidatus Woesebacteria bacterium]MCD8507259.1 hypothetical protein [Candidatus Woesebacteria bacterium]MCD8526606.1 hypothetical protein [Candidatus Woesebacteria bacterium]MCD8546001.1 hypothetical protein [Candidatus Woesebacteria bacterium]
MENNPLYQEVTQLLGETYGVDPDELTPESDLMEDIDVKSDVESLGKFVHGLNTTFDIELQTPRFSRALVSGDISTVRDIVNTVEDALLE